MIIATVGAVEQLDQVLKGDALLGRNEGRIAFVGRSNVGKSSLVNVLLGAKPARVSQRPGKTQNIYFYIWKKMKKIVVDLPGYGYAKQSKSERERWGIFVRDYLIRDPKLERVLVLLDARRELSSEDIQVIRFLSEECALSVLFVMTKSDQLKTQSQRAITKRETEKMIRELGYGAENIFWLSSKTKLGINKLEDEIKTPPPPLRRATR